MSANKLPSDFDTSKFLADLTANMSQLIGFISSGERGQWLQEYNQRVMECFVSSSHFNSFEDEKRVELVETHYNIMFALKLLFNIITDEVTEHETDVAPFVRNLRFSTK